MGNISYIKRTETIDLRNYFNEWNTTPIIKLNMKGEVASLNLAVRALFPDLISQNKQHPLIKGIIEEIVHLVQYSSEVIIFMREVSYLNYIFEQQIFATPGNDSINIYMKDITHFKQLDLHVINENDIAQQVIQDQEHQIQLLQIKLEQLQNRLSQDSVDMLERIESADIGTWHWDILHNIITLDEKAKKALNLTTEKHIFNYENLSQVIHPEDLPALLIKIKDSANNGVCESELRFYDHEGQVFKITVRGKIVRSGHQPIRMSGIVYKKI